MFPAKTKQRKKALSIFFNLNLFAKSLWKKKNKKKKKALSKFLNLNLFAK